MHRFTEKKYLRRLCYKIKEKNTLQYCCNCSTPNKPNPKGISFKWRDSATRDFSSLKPPAPKNKPFQTFFTPLSINELALQWGGVGGGVC